MTLNREVDSSTAELAQTYGGYHGTGVSETIHTAETYPPQPLANFIDDFDDFHHAIRDEREPAASGLDGLRVVQVTLAMIASARDQRTIRIDPMTV